MDSEKNSPERHLPPSGPPPPGSPPPGPPSAASGLSYGGSNHGKVTAIAAMTLAGGIWALLVALGLIGYGLLAGLATLGIGCLVLIPAAYSLVLGIMATLKGARLLGNQPQAEAPPKDVAIMQIINVICCDFVNVVLGILTLVFLSDPEVNSFYQGQRR